MAMNGNGRVTPPSPIPDLTKSPSKSKSRKIAKFFRSRSKSPKTAAVGNNCGVTSSSDSGKSSVGSDKPNCKISSSSSCSSGSSSTVGSKPSKTSCLSSPNKKKLGGSLLKLSTMASNGNHGTDYQFTCDSSLPLFVPTPGTVAVGQKAND
ncbi:unnamed protein product [Allacma fusca]|uniref:Uncharacterized protein n=1 Tax=Allacma fusca TaxID=39272 RepID=A0A8J2K2Z6_9HEXA|nr:unnamed protein product [Allacma fusca]